MTQNENVVSNPEEKKDREGKKILRWNKSQTARKSQRTSNIIQNNFDDAVVVINIFCSIQKIFKVLACL